MVYLLIRCIKVAFVAIANRYRALFLSESSFADGEEKLNAIAFEKWKFLKNEKQGPFNQKNPKMLPPKTN